MKLQKHNILFFLRATQHGGTENVVIQLCKILEPYVNKIVVCSADGMKVNLLFDMGIKHYTIPDVEDKNPKTIFKILTKVNRIIKNEGITVIHTHHRMAAFYTYLIQKVTPIEFINTSHNTFNNKKLLTRVVYENAHLVTCGTMVKRNLVDYYGLTENAITVIHNAVEPFDGETSIIEDLYNLKKSGYRLIGNIGRLSEQKGMEYFIKSIPAVKAKCQNVKFIIVGDGEDKDKLINLAQELKVEDDLVFLGYRNDVRNVITHLDFVVLSSLWEGLPLTPIEAFSVRKTIIATAVDGTPEVVKDNVNGILIESQNTKQLAEKIIWLIENPRKRKCFEEQAYQTYLNGFSFDIFATAYLKYYMSTLEVVIE